LLILTFYVPQTYYEVHIEPEELEKAREARQEEEAGNAKPIAIAPMQIPFVQNPGANQMQIQGQNIQKIGSFMKNSQTEKMRRSQPIRKIDWKKMRSFGNLVLCKLFALPSEYQIDKFPKSYEFCIDDIEIKKLSGRLFKGLSLFRYIVFGILLASLEDSPVIPIGFLCLSSLLLLAMLLFMNVAAKRWFKIQSILNEVFLILMIIILGVLYYVEDTDMDNATVRTRFGFILCIFNWLLYVIVIINGIYTAIMIIRDKWDWGVKKTKKIVGCCRSCCLFAWIERICCCCCQTSQVAPTPTKEEGESLHQTQKVNPILIYKEGSIAGKDQDGLDQRKATIELQLSEKIQHKDSVQVRSNCI